MDTFYLLQKIWYFVPENLRDIRSDMLSKLITKISKRPNFYYFDTAIKDGKKTTIKYCLFTSDENEARMLAEKIKSEVNLVLMQRVVKKPTSLALLIKNQRRSKEDIDSFIKTNKLFLDIQEYKSLFQSTVAKFYNVSLYSEQNESTLEICPIVQKDTQNLKQHTTFEQIAKRYVKNECEKLKSSNKTKGYYIKTGKILDEFLKNKHISDVTYSDAESFQINLLNTQKLHKKTVNNYISYSKRLFDYAIKINEATSNPFKTLTSFKISLEEKSPKDNFTMDELKLVLDTNRLDLRDYMLFALYTGLRLNEIWQLDSSSIGEQEGIKFINVKTAKQKGGAVKYRQIPVHRDILYLSDMRWLEEIKMGKSSCDYFSKRLNKHIHKIIPEANVSFHRLRGNFAKAIKDYCLENGIADITSILLGHSADLATDTYAKGISLKAKQKAMGGLDIFKFLKE